MSEQAKPRTMSAEQLARIFTLAEEGYPALGTAMQGSWTVTMRAVRKELDAERAAHEETTACAKGLAERCEIAEADHDRVLRANHGLMQEAHELREALEETRKHIDKLSWNAPLLLMIDAALAKARGEVLKSDDADYPDTCERCGMDLVDREAERDHTDTRHCHNCADGIFAAKREDRHPL